MLSDIIGKRRKHERYLCEKAAIVQECTQNGEGFEEIPSIVQAFVRKLAGSDNFTHVKM